jgi:hypothetical protein
MGALWRVSAVSLPSCTHASAAHAPRTTHHAQGDTWPAVLKGHELDPVTQQQDQQRLMLERFQREVRGDGAACVRACVCSCVERIDATRMRWSPAPAA